MENASLNRGSRTNIRKVASKIAAVETDEGAGVTVKRVFPTKYLMYFDPFVLLDEFSLRPPAGFPDHPHGGFEAITYMLEGGFHHTDNIGNDRIIMAGGLQKFTAGKGIVHSEMPGINGLNRGLQLWIRLPSRIRDIQPEYQQVEPAEIPEKKHESYHIRIIAGKNSPVKLHTRITYLDVNLLPEGKFIYRIDSEANALLYLLEGALIIGPSQVKKSEAALLTTGGKVETAATEETRFVLISGKPHGEPITLRGSFVY